MIQSNTMTRLAVDVFKEEGEIRIGGHGVLKKMFFSAFLSEEENMLHPPREHYFFNRNEYTESDSCLINRVGVYFMLSDEEAALKVKMWENELVENSQLREVLFGNYGAFNFNDDQLGFTSNALLYYEWLPVLNYRISVPVSREILSHNEDMADDVLLPAGEINSRKKLFPLLWSVLSILFIFSFFLWFKPLSMVFDNTRDMNTRLVNVAPKSYSVDKEPAYYSDTNPMKQTERTATTVDDLNRNVELQDAKKTAKDYKGTESETSLSSKLLQEDAETFSDLDVVAHETKPLNLPCTLIVGAFENNGNVEKMVDRLIAMDLHPITLKRKTITLVGAEVKCSDQSIIKEIRVGIDPEAWFYKK